MSTESCSSRSPWQHLSVALWCNGTPSHDLQRVQAYSDRSQVLPTQCDIGLATRRDRAQDIEIEIEIIGAVVCVCMPQWQYTLLKGILVSDWNAGCEFSAWSWAPVAGTC